MSKEERFETQFDGNKWLVADKENDTLLGGFGAGKMLNEFVKKVTDLKAKLEKLELTLGFACKSLIADLNFENEEQKEHELKLHIERYKSKAGDWLSDYFKLEAKLAELEQENRELHTSINLSIPNQIAMKDEIERLHTCIDKRISELVDENDNLKQQLAEKDKQIKELTECNQYLQIYRNQDKISFAIAELEKAKELVDLEYGHITIIDTIDNQIASLKKEMK